MTVFSLSDWSSDVQSQFMVARHSQFSCFDGTSCPLRFETFLSGNPFLTSSQNSQFNRNSDVYTCRRAGAHIFTWTVGVPQGQGVSTLLNTNLLLDVVQKWVICSIPPNHQLPKAKQLDFQEYLAGIKQLFKTINQKIGLPVVHTDPFDHSGHANNSCLFATKSKTFAGNCPLASHRWKYGE